MKFRRIIRAAALIIILTGIGILLYPRLSNWMYQRKVDQMKTEFISVYSSDDPESDTRLEYLDLLRAMQEYNARLETTGQAELAAATGYEHACIDLAAWGIEDNIAGYIDIPAIDITLPIYLGATEDNMAKGAVHLDNTSLPIGSFQGVSSNCVIAAHRGHNSTEDMFRYLPDVQIGDVITITNLWETLTYQVVETKIISPTDCDQILIQDGRDLITLSTCHPYPYNYQRYIVYCERVLDDTALSLHEGELNLFTDALDQNY